MKSVYNRWPRAIIQFEDFSSDKAQKILDTYRKDHLCFNDDIQGTGASEYEASRPMCLAQRRGRGVQ